MTLDDIFISLSPFQRCGHTYVVLFALYGIVSALLHQFSSIQPNFSAFHPISFLQTMATKRKSKLLKIIGRVIVKDVVLFFIKTSQSPFISASLDSRQQTAWKKHKEKCGKRKDRDMQRVSHIQLWFLEFHILCPCLSYTLYLYSSLLLFFSSFIQGHFALSHFKPIYLHDKFCLFVLLSKHCLPSQHQMWNVSLHLTSNFAILSYRNLHLLKVSIKAIALIS